MSLPSRSLLDRDILKIREKLLQMTSMVDEAIDKAILALNTYDVQLAQEVIVGDNELNHLRHDVEDTVYMTLATQSPAASDLRTIIAAIHLAVELERMGDHAAGIASLVKRMTGQPEIDASSKLPKMAKRARQMVQEGIQAFLDRDVERARNMIKRDNKLDKQYNKLFRETLHEMTDEESAQRATFLLWVGHNLERIGDRATNIAERVIFLVTGEFVENIDEPDDLTAAS
ncbi:MAG: phosphate signaling complex protein PhoU [Anaerolineales bacterium]|nr:phosphate signaling complex protein PhoU [Anaerolineales bacterium]MCA9975060.1 phosphate signaling complex protein PhoU [Anaerolineales bacterium]MCB8967273.1 phosphate signaling complex protein PhoU [Ardenticatenaceae bacterium]